MTDAGILVVVPHSGIVIPSEIPLDALSDDFPVLAQNVDWYTNWLYDFRDILGNRQLIFPYCSIVVEANRLPEALDDSVPLRDVHGRPIYREDREPTVEIRKRMAVKYLAAFHQSIEENIAAGATFLLDGHSTVTARGVAENQIDLMNFQHSPLDDGPLHYCPDVFVETYAGELRQRVPDVHVTVNASDYYRVYGHVCAAHSVNAMTRVGSRVPALIQETNERLYKNADGTPNLAAVNRLRRAFAESLAQALHLIGQSEKEARTS